MDPIAQLFTPVQHAAVWLGAFIHHRVAYDDMHDALFTLATSHRFNGGDGPGLAEMCKLVRRASSGAADRLPPGHPLVQLVLTGPGDIPPVAAGTEAARTVTATGAGALVVADANPAVDHVFVPVPEHPVDLAAWDPDDGPATGWNWRHFRVGTTPTPPAAVGAGDADHLLTTATDRAAALVAQAGGRTTRAWGGPDPRLTVGRLSDYYDYPGLPPHTPARTLKLLARADRVTAIIHTTVIALNDHSFDGELYQLARPIRLARQAAVNYALAEFARTPTG
ncbi:hypothetical protein ACFSSC_03805 [Corynebacterium mendelii]|uniref:Uncharacterized protein n=1 Tax=Corynebacterium mendelii TaxID=2765362 RepID=A0A939E0G7_9CORY|nr:hypothetical protein [Corynebacterium mendelii]MBN9643471.1 hypothetical protein [Corynebacterium mendelii]